MASKSSKKKKKSDLSGRTKEGIPGKPSPRERKKVLTPEVLPAEGTPQEAEEEDFENDESQLPVLRATPGELVPFEGEPRDGEVSTSDPLQRYLQELRRYPLLTPEQQHELAIRFRETGDLQFARALVTANLRLVVKIAMEYRTTYANVLDLVQEGNVGLMKAVSNYDPYKGTRLSYYASWWIRSYILKFLLDNFRLVKVGTTQAQKKLFYNLMREKERLEAQGIQAGPKLLADKLNVREKDVEEMSLRLSHFGSEVSIDKPMGDGEERKGTFADTLEDGGEGMEERLVHTQLANILRDKIDSFLTTLNEKERVLFQERLMSEDPKTLQEVADKFGITRERARQIESNIIAKLREHMKEHLELGQ